MSDDFATYISARWPALVRSALLLGCSREEAEDVVQTALIRCYRSWDKVTRASDTDAYVYRTLINVLTKSRKRRWWGEEPTAEPADVERPDTTESLAVRHTVAATLSRMSPEHRAVLVLRFFADLSERQVAEVLGVPPGTVKSRTARALATASRDADLAQLYEEMP
ncbi:SigE family RNA polymerase sigma factor [soil metagenome]